MRLKGVVWGCGLTVLLRWSISCARMLEMALRTVDCTNVTVSGDAILWAWSWPWTESDMAVGTGAAKTRNRVLTQTIIDCHS